MIRYQQHLGCNKDGKVKLYCFFNLRVEGQEEDIKWEIITSNWIDTLGSAHVEPPVIFLTDAPLN
jgi:hypothetical protein